MTRNTIFGILAVLAIASFAIPGAAAMQCNDGKMAIMSPSDRIACVYEKTFEKLLERGWMEVNQIALSESLAISDNVNVDTENGITVKSVTGSHELFGYAKPYEITYVLPNELILNQPVTVEYSYKWPTLFGYEDGEIVNVPFLNLPEEIETDMAYYGSGFADYYTPHKLKTHNLEIPYHANSTGTASFTMTLTKPLIYDEDMIHQYNSNEYFDLIKTDTGLTIYEITDENYHDWWYLQNYGDYRYANLYSNDTHVPEPRPEPKVSDQLQQEPVDYLPEAAWPAFADSLRFLRDSHNFTDYEGYYERAGEPLTEKFWKDFYEAYPEFLIRDTNLGLTGQADPPLTILSQRILHLYDINGNRVPTANVNVCLFDVDQNIQSKATVLTNGNLKACQITNERGEYNLFAITLSNN